MNDTITFINNLMKPQEQWAMSYVKNEPGMSLPEYHPVEEEPTAIPSVQLGSEDVPSADELADKIADILRSDPSFQPGKADDITKALEKLLDKQTPDDKAQAQIDLYEGAVMKTVAAASDTFNSVLGIAYGGNIDIARDAAIQNYQNQMDALDNQVLYIKHQLSDRFNKTIETNMVQMAARNLRVNAGNVLELSKEEASEITEDMRTAESNARLKKIAYEAGQKQAKASAKYAHAQQWFGLSKSLLKLGMMYESGGGTDMEWGDLYKGYMAGTKYFNEKRELARTQQSGSLNSIY